MNNGTIEGAVARFLYRTFLAARHFLPSPSTSAISRQTLTDAIRRIYVINLDRQDERWRQMQRELRWVRDQDGRPLTAVTRRFSAVDARYYGGVPPADIIDTSYSLADQLFVDPQPLAESDNTHENRVQMSRQEIAVALSHVGVWKAIARGSPGYTLVLEDDVYFRPRFVRSLDGAWADLKSRRDEAPADIVYLSYEEARAGAVKEPVSEHLFQPARGLWCLSGYVLSRRGARKLLNLLPVRGPVDLWINHQFGDLDVFATTESLIEQRQDLESGNEYSILPVLSKVGILTREKPLLFEPPDLPAPVIAVGAQGSGLTSLAMALSMLGYRCCSDVCSLPGDEHQRLFSKRKRIFDAYLNVGSLDLPACISLAKMYRDVRFIIMGSDGTTRPEWAEVLGNETGDVLMLPSDHQDKWELISKFLDCEYPSHPYPELSDRTPRQLLHSTPATDGQIKSFRATTLEADSSPWAIREKDWTGMRLAEADGRKSAKAGPDIGRTDHVDVDVGSWILRDDTFPSNLALFRPSNVSVHSNGVTRLTLCEESTPVRELTAASICSRERYLYGRFGADVRPPAVSGAITGLFLHRNRPRQEIDIEFLGAKPAQMLVNVFYNPGGEGTKMEYGYRGTPVLIDLGFDATAEFHRYEIEWKEGSIRWWVDGELAHERVCWNPTPVPHLPMQLNANIWHSRSEKLAGSLARGDLPAVAEFKGLQVLAQQKYQVSLSWPAHSK